MGAEEDEKKKDPLAGAGKSRHAAVMCLAVDYIRGLICGGKYDFTFANHVQSVRNELPEKYREILDRLRTGGAVEKAERAEFCNSLQEIREKYFELVANLPSNPYLAREKAYRREKEMYWTYI